MSLIVPYSEYCIRAGAKKPQQASTVTLREREDLRFEELGERFFYCPRVNALREIFCKKFDYLALSDPTPAS
jgi:hypothetical protein